MNFSNYLLKIVADVFFLLVYAVRDCYIYVFLVEQIAMETH